MRQFQDILISLPIHYTFSYFYQSSLQQLEVNLYICMQDKNSKNPSTGIFNREPNKNVQNKESKGLGLGFSLAKQSGQSEQPKIQFTLKKQGGQTSFSFGNQSAASKPMFGGEASPMFGGSSSSNPFTKSSTQTGFLKTQNNSLFGNPPAQKNDSLFGGLPPKTQNTSLFGGDSKTSVTPIFGGAPKAQNTSLFGGDSKTSVTPIFGGAPKAQNTPSLFGGSKTSDTPLFGPSSQAQNTPPIFQPPKTSIPQSKNQVPSGEPIKPTAPFSLSGGFLNVPVGNFLSTNTPASGLFKSSINNHQEGLFQSNSKPTQHQHRKKSSQKLDNSQISYKDSVFKVKGLDEQIEGKPSVFSIPSKLDSKSFGTIKIEQGGSHLFAPELGQKSTQIGLQLSKKPSINNAETSKKPSNQKKPQKEIKEPYKQTKKRVQQLQNLQQNQNIDDEIEQDIRRGRQITTKAQMQKIIARSRNQIKKQLIEKLKNKKNYEILENQRNLYDKYILNRIKKLQEENKALQRQADEKQGKLKALKIEIQRLQQEQKEQKDIYIQTPSLKEKYTSLQKQDYSVILKSLIPEEDLVNLAQQCKALQKQADKLQAEIAESEEEYKKQQIIYKNKQQELLTIKSEVMNIFATDPQLKQYCDVLTQSKLELEALYKKLKQEIKYMKKNPAKSRVSINNSLIR